MGLMPKATLLPNIIDIACSLPSEATDSWFTENVSRERWSSISSKRHLLLRYSVLSFILRW